VAYGTQANRTFMMSCMRETLSILVFDYFRNKKSMELLAAFALQQVQPMPQYWVSHSQSL